VPGLPGLAPLARRVRLPWLRQPRRMALVRHQVAVRPGLCKRKVSATAGTIFDKTLPARLTREWTRGIVNSRRSTNTPGLAQHGRAT
jgi:hypothetical protein